MSYEAQPPCLRVTGDEDRTTAGRRRRSLSCALSAREDVIVDLSQCHFADASLMVDLAVLGRRLAPRGGTVHLCGAQPQIHRLIELTGLHRLDTICVESSS